MNPASEPTKSNFSYTPQVMPTVDLELPIYPQNLRFSLDNLLNETEFACDLDACKGACCTMPGAYGAPLLESERADLERVFPAVKNYLSAQALETLEREGLWVRDANGAFATPVINRRD